MSTRTTAVLATSVAAMLLLCLAGPAILIGGVAAACTPASATPSPLDDWDTEQSTNAQIIIAIGSQKGVPTRGWVIAVATALPDGDGRPAAERPLGLVRAPTTGSNRGAMLRRPTRRARR